MCGVAGTLGPPGDARAAAETMAASLAHRGPDAAGVWGDPEAGVALAHRRLAVIDPSGQGAQPMGSADGRWVIVYNGELYNAGELRAELGGSFRGHSDTEALVEAIARWGVAGALRRVNGMFAFAAWDADRRVVWIARDRIGEKPFVYTRMDGRWVFASDVRALRAHPSFRPDVDRRALSLYVRHNYVPAPWSIHAGVRKVLPGTAVALHAGGREDTLVYWSALDAAERGLADPLGGDPSVATDAVGALLADAVERRMVSDVPLGAFLSGGIDSSLVVALMQARSARPVRTFSIGFQELGFDEAPHAKAVAHHLGTDHTELYVTPRDAMEVVPELSAIYDEPFGDSSQIPTVLVSRLARRDVTVALSGDGGDELFGGYDRYRLTSDAWRRISRVPGPMRRLASPRLVRTLAPLVLRGRRLGHRAEVAARLSRMSSGEALYLDAISLWKDPAAVVLGGSEPPTAHTTPDAWPDAPLHERMLYLDLVGYLPDDILVKVDRASMSASLEARVPMLDHRLVELAWRVPSGLRRGKLPLRALLARHVPRALFERPKQGFGVPVGAWLRGPLRGWADDLLRPRRIRDEGFLDADAITRRWSEHREGRADWSPHLWTVLQFQAWLEAL